MIGQTINNYILERKLGEGGMGTVYFARHSLIERVVAIKVLHKTLFTQTNIRNRFKNEANALIKLGHPNIVKIYDYIEQDELACLIMEYIAGFTLDDYIMKITGPLPAPKATGIICGVLDAVQYAHDKNIFHRDIKPGNIMVSKDGKTVKIMDFGIAKLTNASNLKTTHANAQLGTPFYMSPEQVKGLPYTALSDIYSLGVTLFEMVTGKCPYQEITNLFELQSKIVNEPLPPTRTYYPDVTIKIQEAIIVATDKIPEQRFKNCNEFKNYLLEIENPQPDSVPKQAAKKQTQTQQPALKQPKPETPKPQPIQAQQIFEEKKKINNWIYPAAAVSFLILASLTYLSINQSNSHPRQPKVILTPLAVKRSAKQAPPTSRHDKQDDLTAMKVGVAPNKTNTQILPETRKLKTGKNRNHLSPPITKTDTPPSAAFQNVKEDLMRYLGGRKSFGGVEYNDISEVTIESVSDKGTDELGSRGYDLNITINGEDLTCQIVYILNSNKPQIKALK